MTSIWDPASPLPDPGELTALRNVAAAAKLDGMQMFASVYNFGSRTTPLTEEAQASFANYAATLARQIPDLTNFIIGNEPNINRFWLPQFNADGSDAAAPAYLSLLYRTYTALKAVNPAIKVFGGAVSPRGSRPPGNRARHAFADGLHPGPRRRLPCERADGADDGRVRVPPVPGQLERRRRRSRTRTRTRSASPTTQARRACSARRSTAPASPARRCRSSTASTAIETQIPATKASLYTGAEAPTIKPVPEATQADYYKQAIAIAFCQPNVMGHPDLPRLRRAGARPLPVRPLLRRRHAEVEPDGGA